MILLATNTSIISLVTGGTQSISVQASWVDALGSTITPAPLNTLITSASTTTVVPSPPASTQRNVKYLGIHNSDLTTADNVAVRHFDGTTIVTLIGPLSLQAGYTLLYEDTSGWYVLDGSGGRQGVQGIPGTPGTNGTNGTNAGNIGQKTINFGPAPGSNTASVAVTGQTTILATSACQAFLMEDTSINYTALDHQYAALFIVFTCSVPTAGVGFTIDATSANPMQGQFTIRYVWN